MSNSTTSILFTLPFSFQFPKTFSFPQILDNLNLFSLVSLERRDTTLLAGVLVTATPFLYYYGDDILRFIKVVLSQLGLGSGLVSVPGPSTDTRFLRFSHGDVMTTDYLKAYGPLYKIFSGSMTELVLTHPEDVQSFYQGDAKAHPKMPNVGFGHYMGRILGECVGFKHTDDWRRIRSHTDRHFTASIAIESIPVLMKDVKEWFDGLEGKGFIKPISEKGKKMEVMASDLFWDIPFKMISKVIFGEMLDDNLFKELWSYNGLHERLMMTSFFGKLEQWALSSYLPTAANRDMAAFQRGWGDLLKRVSNEAYEKGIFMPVGEMYKKVLDGEMTFPEFTHTIDETLFTNIDATTVSIMWAVTLVAQHEEVQERLLSEIAQIWEPEGDEEDQLNLYLKRTDTLLHHCYMESGRLRPILFYSMSEQTADSKVIRGHVIPAETSILINGHALNRVSPIWSPDGDVFRPDRFASLSPAVYRYSFWRFGMGPRKCLGMHFADKVVKCCLFESVRRYKISVRGEVDVRRDRFVQMPLATLVFERH